MPVGGLTVKIVSMCGRYTLTKGLRELAERFGVNDQRVGAGERPPTPGLRRDEREVNSPAIDKPSNIEPVKDA